MLKAPREQHLGHHGGLLRARFGLVLGPQTAHLVQHGVQSLAVNELHGVVMDALVFADAEHRHDVGMVQPGRRAGLAAEALELLGLHQRTGGQDFQGHMAAERFLHRLVDHSHPAPTDLAEQAILSELSRNLLRRRRGRFQGRRLFDTATSFLHHHQGGEQAADVVGQVGMACFILAHRRPFAGPQACQERFRELLQRVALRRVLLHTHGRRSCLRPDGKSH
jgi:hypothetical protein